MVAEHLGNGHAVKCGIGRTCIGAVVHVGALDSQLGLVLGQDFGVEMLNADLRHTDKSLARAKFDTNAALRFEFRPGGRNDFLRANGAGNGGIFADVLG